MSQRGERYVEYIYICIYYDTQPIIHRTCVGIHYNTQSLYIRHMQVYTDYDTQSIILHLGCHNEKIPQTGVTNKQQKFVSHSTGGQEVQDQLQRMCSLVEGSLLAQRQLLLTVCSPERRKLLLGSFSSSHDVIVPPPEPFFIAKHCLTHLFCFRSHHSGELMVRYMNLGGHSHAFYGIMKAEQSVWNLQSSHDHSRPHGEDDL